MKSKLLVFIVLLFAFQSAEAQTFVYDYVLSESSKDSCLPGDTLRVTYDEESSYLELGEEYGGVYISYADYSYKHVNQGKVEDWYTSTLGQIPSYVENNFVQMDKAQVFTGVRTSLLGQVWFAIELVFTADGLDFNLSGTLEANKECTYNRL